MNSKQKANEIYNTFENPDMPRHEFIREYVKLTDPVNLRQDLTNILHNKHKIDSAIN